MTRWKQFARPSTAGSPHLAEARFSKRDFYEDSDGTIRITRPLTSHLAMTAPIWRPAAQAVAGWLARALTEDLPEKRRPHTSPGATRPQTNMARDATTHTENLHRVRESAGHEAAQVLFLRVCSVPFRVALVPPPARRALESHPLNPMVPARIGDSRAGIGPTTDIPRERLNVADRRISLKNSNFQVDHNSEGRWQPQRKVSLGVRRTNRFCRVQRSRMPCRQY